MSRKDYSTSLAHALDMFEAPPLSPQFAARVAAAAARPATPSNAMPALRPRRDAGRGRGLAWSRRRSAALGIVAAGLMSATAAAAGLFGDLGVTLPALERVVERIAREAAPAPSSPVARVRPSLAADTTIAPAETIAPAPQAEPTAPPAVDLREGVRREIAARGIAAGIERRIERRERLGLPVPRRIADPTVRLSPERAALFPKRAALIERVQDIRQGRRERSRPGTESVPAIAPDPAAPAPSTSPNPANGALANEELLARVLAAGEGTPQLPAAGALPPSAEAPELSGEPVGERGAAQLAERPRELRDMSPAERMELARRLRELRERRQQMRRQRPQ